jgi:ribosomal protein L37AE/L43A
MQITQKDIDRFWTKVEKTEKCWNWKAVVASTGRYGLFTVRGEVINTRKVINAHRFAYFITFGQVDRKIDIDHICRNTLCVNPSHLEAVSHAENIFRGYMNKPRKTHCPRGHEKDRKATGRNGRTLWRCSTCERDAWQARKKSVLTSGKPAAKK